MVGVEIRTGGPTGWEIVVSDKGEDVVAALAPFGWQVTDAVAVAASEEGRRIADVWRQPFDLETGPVLRAFLLRRSPTEHALLLNLHHMITDGWSMNVLIDEWLRGYDALLAGRPLPFQPLAKTPPYPLRTASAPVIASPSPSTYVDAGPTACCIPNPLV